MDWTGIVAAVVGAGGLSAILASIANYYLSRAKQASDVDFSLLDRLDKRLADVEKKHAECQEQNAQLREKIIRLEEAISDLEGARISCEILAGSDGLITDVSESTGAILGWSKEALVGKPIHILVPVRLRGAHYVAFQAAVHDNRGPKVDIIRDAFALSRTGQEVPVTINLSSWVVGETRVYAAQIRRRY